MNYFSVYRSENRLQINDSWENISYLEKITLPWKETKIHRSKSAYFTTLTYPKSPVFFFFYNNGYYETAIEIFHEMDTETRMIEIKLIVHCDTVPTFLEVYVFGFPDYVPEPKKGLAVYNSNGRLIFSSDQRYLNIIGAVKNMDIRDKVKKFPPHKKIAVGISSIHVYEDSMYDVIDQTIYCVTLLPKNEGVKITPVPNVVWIGGWDEENWGSYDWGLDSMLTFADITGY